jgi:hypothetical protein
MCLSSVLFPLPEPPRITKHLSAPHLEVEIAHEQLLPIADRQVLDSNDRFGHSRMRIIRHSGLRCGPGVQMSRTWNSTAHTPSTAMIRMMPPTTARVVDCPTALGPSAGSQPLQAADARDQQAEHKGLGHAAEQIAYNTPRPCTCWK